MTRKSGGTKRSSWLTFRRRLLLIRLLLRSPMKTAELINNIQREMGENGYPESAPSALKHDFDALKEEFGCAIRFRRETGCYHLEDLGELALLDLPDTSLEALAFLDNTFRAGEDLPEHANIRELLERVDLLLPAHRRAHEGYTKSLMSLNLMGNTHPKINPDVLNTVKRAIRQRRELTFAYFSLSDVTEPRRHRVAPYRIYFRPEGHAYLDATLIEATPAGNEPQHAPIDYRLDRIIPGTVEVLAQVLPRDRPPAQSFRIRYRLFPAIARRRDIATYFPGTHIDYHEDGSATVSATVTNLWLARQILLRYGPGCKVLEPPELVELFRAAVRGLSTLYEQDEATDV